MVENPNIEFIKRYIKKPRLWHSFFKLNVDFIVILLLSSGMKGKKEKKKNFNKKRIELNIVFEFDVNLTESKTFGCSWS